ncbi:UNVERIFIED_CONTAM: hypothetical protein K2H54_027962 [Gekko kuhli]
MPSKKIARDRGIIPAQSAILVHKIIADMYFSPNQFTCISWSSYHKNLLASSDYEGTVILWDGFTGQRSKVYQEHEKRCWSVDFNLMDPKLLASGSDDAKAMIRRSGVYRKLVSSLSLPFSLHLECMVCYNDDASTIFT